ncbi:MAG: LacI family DNA-binding transcriptional regulator [Rhizobiaceae bacterium]|nr:LacI family DNA-binding transcriptional regulator [Rhizobiaceae bacterium]
MALKSTSRAGETKAPSSSDVARLAGVSQTTTSIVLNGQSKKMRISDETRERVLAAASSLGYMPNHAARSLRRRSTKTITFVLPTLENPYFSEIVGAAQEEARQHGYSVTIVAMRSELGDFRTSSLLQGAAYDGIVVAGHDNCAATELLQLADRGVAVVVLQEPSPSASIGSVRVDLETGGYLATRHLVELGHRRIAHVTQPLRKDEFGGGRVDGYRRALAEADIPFDEALVVTTANSMEGGAEALNALVDLDPRPTAAFMYNDRLAVGGLHALRKRGLVVPDDFAVVGFDGVAIGRFTAPTLTTIDSPRDELGRLAIKVLLGILDGDQEAQEHLLPVKLVVRASCGAERRANPSCVQQPTS